MSLALPPDELRALGHRVVDALVQHWSDPGAGPPLRTGSRAELEAVLREPPPEGPGSAADALDLLLRDVLPFIQHGDHPRFFARVPSPSNPVSVLADALASALNVFSGSWNGGSGPAGAGGVLPRRRRRPGGGAGGGGAAPPPAGGAAGGASPPRRPRP